MLEDRTTPAGVVGEVHNHVEPWDLAPNYTPPSQHLVNLNGFLTGPQSGDPGSIAIGYLRDHAADLGLSRTDTERYIVTDYYTDEDAVATTHIYLRQSFNGLPVVNANININVSRSGQVINLGSTFYGGLSAWETSSESTPTPGISAGQAIVSVARRIGYESTQAPMVTADSGSHNRQQTFVASDLSDLPIPARLAYAIAPDGAHLTWNVMLRTPDGEHWYDAFADANTGELLSLSDWTAHASYQVYPMPQESPSDGSFQTVVNPSNATSSPFGWHDTNGVAGAEFADTRGNNVNAQEDVNADNAGGFRPSGGAGLSFVFPFDLTQPPSAYQSGAITNLFYWNNILHDVHYAYGFTPAAGNFQTNTYGGGGSGNDAVIADAQDGSGVNNANFATPPDGTAPRMQTYIFYAPTPDRDSALDAGVITHEYGHGLSNRLTGGPANANALSNVQSNGMGEGWSDFFALMLTQKSTDAQNDAYPFGTYVLGQAPTGAGFRRQPYSYNMAINNQTIGLYNTSSEVHNTGELWCAALWDLNWLLINKFGYDANLYTGYAPGGGPASAGNKLMLRLVEDAMKLQPANPSFLDGRNAIFAADQVLTGGANKAEIWQAFARRGMGVSFIDTGSTASSVTQAFDLPSSFSLPLAPSGTLGTTVYTGSVAGALPVAGAVDSYTISLDTGQKATLYVTPTDPALQPTVELRDPANLQIGTNGAALAGSPAMLQGISLTSAGAYTINVSGGGSTTGSYSLRLMLNAVTEGESIAGAANNTIGAAQNIESYFSAPYGSGQIATVLATSDLPGAMPSESESNDTIATANSIASNFNVANSGVYHLGISGELQTGVDNDFFNIGVLQVGDVITITQSGSASLRGACANPFVYVTRAGAGGVVVYDDDNGPGSDSLIHRFTVAVTDTYYARAFRVNSTDIGTYQLSMYLENAGATPNTGGALVSDIEPNDSPATSNDASGSWRPIQYLSRTNGSISTTSDADLYATTFQAGDLVSAYVKSLSGLDARLSLLNSSGATIAADDGSSGLGSDAPMYAYVIPTTGTYYFSVGAASGTTGAGAYYLDVGVSSPAVPPTPPIVPDYFSFLLSAGQKVSVALKNLSVGNLNLDVLDAGGNSLAVGGAIATNYDGNITNITAPATGAYFVRVTGVGLVNYNLSVARGMALELEDNNSFGVGTNINGVSGVLGHAVDDDFFRINVLAGQTITLQTSTPGGGAGQFVNALNPAIDFYDPTGVLIASDDNSAPDARNALLVRMAPTSGLYGVRVRGVSATTGEYFLSAVLSAADITPPTITGVYFDGAAWTAAFRAAAGNATYGYPAQTGAGQLTAMPWSTMNAIYVKFSEDVTVLTGTLGVRGINVANYPTTLASYDNLNFVAKFTLAAPIDTDRLILDLDGASANAVADLAGNKLAGSWTENSSSFPTAGLAGVNFQYRLAVAVGDADRNGQVRNTDVNLVRNNLFVDAGAGGYSIFADIDGNGQTRNADLNGVRNHLFIDPPSGPGPNRPGRGSSTGSGGRHRDGNRAGSVAFRLSTDLPLRAAPLRRPSAVILADQLDMLFTSD